MEIIWKALKCERHMLRNSEDCSQRIYSREQTRVSDNVIALSLLLMHLRDTEAICLTYWSSFMQNHQPHILSIHNGKYLTLQLTTLVLKHKAQAIVTIFSLEFSGSTGQISQWKTALPSITSKPRKNNIKINLQALINGLRLLGRQGRR